MVGYVSLFTVKISSPINVDDIQHSTDVSVASTTHHESFSWFYIPNQDCLFSVCKKQQQQTNF